MTLDAWITTAVLAVAIVLLVTDKASTVVVMGGAVIALLLGGVIDEDQAIAGLGSESAITIAALYVLAGAASATGALGGVVDRILRGTGSVARLCFGTILISPWVPNTPLVALFAPRVVRWARLNQRPASRYLMPLSYATVLGGVVTVIGTSTNLVVSDVLEQAGRDRLGVFEITPVGLPVAVAGVIVLAVLAPRLLPDRVAAGEAMRESARRYRVVMRIDPDGPLVGRTIGEAALRELDGVFLAAVERDGHLVPSTPDTVLAAGDDCSFVGDVSRVMDLHAINGLRSSEHTHLLDAEGPGGRLYEAVVGDRSALAGATLKSVGFRARYGGAVLAVHRANGELTGKLGEIELRSGDVLLVLAGQEFDETWGSHHDFALVASLTESPPPRSTRAWLVTAAFLGMVVLASANVMSLLEAAIIGCVVVLAGGAMTLREAGQSINLDVVLTIATSVSIGTAVQTSGLAEEVAGWLGRVADPLGTVGLLAAVLVTTMILTELLSNNAAAAVMVPVAIATAVESGADVRAFAVAVLIGASCSFLSPIGYQTNLMVYGLGGYRFADFTRLGLPLTVLTAIVTTVAISLVML